MLKLVSDSHICKGTTCNACFLKCKGKDCDVAQCSLPNMDSCVHIRLEAGSQMVKEDFFLTYLIIQYVSYTLHQNFLDASSVDNSTAVLYVHVSCNKSQNASHTLFPFINMVLYINPNMR